MFCLQTGSMQGGDLVLVVVTAEFPFGFSNSGWSREMFAARWGNKSLSLRII